MLTCGFPLNTEKKVRTKLEERKMNYMLLDPRNEYHIDAQEDFRKLNNYEIELNKAYSFVKNKKKIKRISEELELFIDKPNFKEVIRKIEDLLDESREV